MSITSRDSDFISKRESLNRLWPWAGITMLLVLFALGAWIWMAAPYLIDPWSVFNDIKAGTLPGSRTSLMALMLPIVVLTLLFFVGAMILILFASFSNERRLLRIIRQLQQTE